MPRPALFPYTTLFRSVDDGAVHVLVRHDDVDARHAVGHVEHRVGGILADGAAIELDVAVCNRSDQPGDRKSTRLNSSHLVISYAVFCLKKKKEINQPS